MQLSFNFKEMFSQTDANNGLGINTLQSCIKQHLKGFSTDKILITLNNGQEMEFLSYSEKGKTVIISTDCLSSNCNSNEGINIEHLPEILEKLTEQKIQFDLLQFPHAFRVTGQFTGIIYRNHFNHIIISKDADQISTGIIDSTVNPFGVSNPLGLFSRSLLSGRELTHNTLNRLCNTNNARAALGTLCGLKSDKKVQVANTIYTMQQAINNNKRCGIYVMNGMAELANSVFQGQKINCSTITATVTQAHKHLNDLEQQSGLNHPLP